MAGSGTLHLGARESSCATRDGRAVRRGWCYLRKPMGDIGRIAVVTGASRRIGIGAAIARALAQAEHDVFITYHRPYDASMPWGSRGEDVDELLAELHQIGVRAAGIELDLARADAAPRL